MKKITNKFINNQCSEQEFNSFVEIMADSKNNKLIVDEMNEHWDELPKEGETPDLQGTLHKIHFEINKRIPVISKTRKLSLYITRVAAILLLPMAIGFYLQYQSYNKAGNFSQTISTPLASKTSFDLPDGSKVWLNSGSTIKYNKSFGRKDRQVTLIGEAYFDVQKSKVPFQVKTANFNVNVLGTAFNVMAYDHEIPSVTLERGKVWLETKSNKKSTLLPGQQAIIDTLKNSISLKNVEANIYSAWINNKLIFNAELFGSVIKRLERWYNIQIDLEGLNIENYQITANIEFESIREVMDLMMITLPIKYEYDKNSRKLIIRSSK